MSDLKLQTGVNENSNCTSLLRGTIGIIEMYVQRAWIWLLVCVLLILFVFKDEEEKENENDNDDVQKGNIYINMACSLVSERKQTIIKFLLRSHGSYILIINM